ncbi:MAG: TlpA family protein disulfide reductase [Cyclobacteriaceae bacterium]|nr:TlpA family protein disulfide reductase [Cyclobacteriaceae bacterium]
MRLHLCILIGFFISLFACSESGKQSNQYNISPKEGIWRGILTIQKKEVPFNFSLSYLENGKISVTVMNAGERIVFNEGSIENNTLIIPMGVYDGQIEVSVKNLSMEGKLVKNFVEDYEVPFKAYYGEEFRFDKGDENASVDFSGKYAVKFKRPDGSFSEAIGVFQQNDQHITGTFLTKTGDYRYLEGSVNGNVFEMSAFNGDWVFLVEGKMDEYGAIQGELWSGLSRYQIWTGVKDENVELPDASALTYLKDGYDTFDFTFPDLQGKPVSISDEKYQGKVLIVQILGTWCPNCIDETAFLSDWYRNNRHRGVEIIGLSFENKPDFEYGKKRVSRLLEVMDVPYEILLPGSRSDAADKLPMLNHVMSFPTTIFIDRAGKVRRIHTGFSGPGTGIYYEKFVAEFEEFMNELTGI